MEHTACLSQVVVRPDIKASSNVMKNVKGEINEHFQ